MQIVVLDYRDGSVHFHIIPDDFDSASGIDDIEDYLSDTLEYDTSMVNWMEVLC